MKKILILLLVCIMIVASVQAFEFTYTPDQVERTVCYGPWYAHYLTTVVGTNYEDYPLKIQGHGFVSQYLFLDPIVNGLNLEFVLLQNDPKNPIPIGDYTGAIQFLVYTEPPDPPRLQDYRIPVYLHVRDCSAPPTPVPEFPSPVLPVAMIFGFIGTVLYIWRTKEN